MMFSCWQRVVMATLSVGVGCGAWSLAMAATDEAPEVFALDLDHVEEVSEWVGGERGVGDLQARASSSGGEEQKGITVLIWNPDSQVWEEGEGEEMAFAGDITEMRDEQGDDFVALLQGEDDLDLDESVSRMRYANASRVTYDMLYGAMLTGIAAMFLAGALPLPHHLRPHFMVVGGALFVGLAVGTAIYYAPYYMPRRKERGEKRNW